jgi:hypothetical protein
LKKSDHVLRKGCRGVTFVSMSEIIFTVTQDVGSDALVASWDDPSGGGVTTQANSLSGLESMVRDAIACHFESAALPTSCRLHFDCDPVVAFA